MGIVQEREREREIYNDRIQIEYVLIFAFKINNPKLGWIH